jgi:hypothetical protein
VELADRVEDEHRVDGRAEEVERRRTARDRALQRVVADEAQAGDEVVAQRSSPLQPPLGLR